MDISKIIKLDLIQDNLEYMNREGFYTIGLSSSIFPEPINRGRLQQELDKNRKR